MYNTICISYLQMQRMESLYAFCRQFKLRSWAGPFVKKYNFVLEFGYMNYICDDDTHTQDIIFYFLPSLTFFPGFRFVNSPSPQSYWICNACFMGSSSNI